MEITTDTILRLVLRQGTESERLSAKPINGEPIYISDLKRMFVGDSVTVGGNLVGNKFLGFGPDITLFIGYPGDTAYNSDTNELFCIVSGDGSNITHWTRLAGINNPSMNIRYNGSTNTVSFSSNITSVQKLSTGHYRFSYSPRTNSNLIVNSQMIGLSAPEYQARPLTITNTYTDVVIINNTGSKSDGELSVQINY